MRSTDSSVGTALLGEQSGRQSVAGHSLNASVSMDDPAQIYVNQILPHGKCSHYQKLTKMSERERFKRDQKVIAKIRSSHSLALSMDKRNSESVDRFTEIRKQTKALNQSLRSIIKQFHNRPEGERGRPHKILLQHPSITKQEIDALLQTKMEFPPRS